MSAVKKKRSIKKLVVVQSVPQPVIVDGTAVAAGDRLYSCDDNGVSCYMVLETNPRKRDALLYDVVKLTTLRRNEFQMSQQWRAERWGTTAQDAVRKWDRHRSKELADQHRRVKDEQAGAQAAAREYMRDLNKFDAAKRSAMRGVGALDAAFESVRDSIAKKSK